MSTKTHDEMIEEAVGWAKSLGYGVVESHPGTETGADAVFENHVHERVILEIVTGSRFRELFKKPRIRDICMSPSKDWITRNILGLIVVGDRIDHVKDHGIEVGLSDELFDPPKQRIFPVLVRDFRQIIPVLLVSLLGARASALARVQP